MYERLLKIAEGKRYNFSVKRYRSDCGANFRVGEKSGRGGGGGGVDLVNVILVNVTRSRWKFCDRPIRALLEI